MSQSTKLFLVLLLLFVVYATMRGHLVGYLKVIFG